MPLNKCSFNVIIGHNHNYNSFLQEVSQPQLLIIQTKGSFIEVYLQSKQLHIPLIFKGIIYTFLEMVYIHKLING